MLIDSFARRISYLRVSVTDRCDLRCVYCMPERMRFLPRADVLTLAELERLCLVFLDLGVTKLRITGGEPLLRRDIAPLFTTLGASVRSGALRELTLTTNGTHLAAHSAMLVESGVRRINISLDSRDPDRFRAITRSGDVALTLQGIAAARHAGLRVKINMVVLAGINADEVEDMLLWCHDQGMDLTLIEVMPMGETGRERMVHYVPLSTIRARLAQHYTLDDIPAREHTLSAGPARFVHIRETGGRLGFLTPISEHFCKSCNRLRLTCTGRLYTCLGQENFCDLRPLLRANASDDTLISTIREALLHKPRGHDFSDIAHGLIPSPNPDRHMNMTGG
jgi:GTP 3',8-cyclase